MRGFGLALAASVSVLGLGASGCAGSQPLDVELSNAGEEVLYLDTDSRGDVFIVLEEGIEGQWRELSPFEFANCRPKCSALPGAQVAACFPPGVESVERVFAVMPGDSTTLSYDAEQWWVNPTRNCTKRAPMTGPFRVSLCHSVEVVSASGLPLEPATETGFFGGDEGASFVDAECINVENEVEDGVITVRLAG